MGSEPDKYLKKAYDRPKIEKTIESLTFVLYIVYIPNTLVFLLMQT